MRLDAQTEEPREELIELVKRAEAVLQNKKGRHKQHQIIKDYNGLQRHFRNIQLEADRALHHGDELPMEEIKQYASEIIAYTFMIVHLYEQQESDETN